MLKSWRHASPPATSSSGSTVGAREPGRRLGGRTGRAGRPSAGARACPARRRGRDLDWLSLWAGDHAEVERVVRAAADGLVEDAAGLARSVRPGVEVRTVVVDADARDVLVDASRAANLVVVGSRGHSAWRSATLGSVSSAVCRHASSPVVVAGRGATVSERRGVLVGADGTAGSLPVIESRSGWRPALAATHGHGLLLGHRRRDGARPHRRPRRARCRRPAPDAVRVGGGAQQKYPDVDFEVQLTRGLVDIALTEGTPPVTWWSSGVAIPSSWSRLLYGSATTAVLERAEGSVAVVPEPDPATSREEQS